MVQKNYSITIFTKKIFTPENKHLVWNSAASNQIKVLTPDWSHLKELEQLFEMRLVWLSQLYSFRSNTLPKLMLVLRCKDFYCEDSSLWVV